MRSYLVTIIFLFSSFITFSQKVSDDSGFFGERISADGAIPAMELSQKMNSQDALNIKLKGTITEVCQVKGCWMTIDLGNDQQLRVKFKDYSFFVPKNSAGKTAIIQGTVQKEIISVDELKHLAQDAGKSETEINEINKASEELTFVAEGVIIR